MLRKSKSERITLLRECGYKPIKSDVLSLYLLRRQMKREIKRAQRKGDQKTASLLRNLLSIKPGKWFKLVNAHPYNSKDLGKETFTLNEENKPGVRNGRIKRKLRNAIIREVAYERTYDTYHDALTDLEGREHMAEQAVLWEQDGKFMVCTIGQHGLPLG